MTTPDKKPSVSVVIPTYNRKEMLAEMIGLLTEQTLDPSEFEVLVVDDGGKDGTPEFIEALDMPFALRVVTQPNGGASRARNHGAEEARADMIVFMDDDLVPQPEMIKSHRDALVEDESTVVIGKLMPWDEGSRGAWNRWEDRIYARHYAAVESNRRPPSGRRLYSGNFSVWRQAFLNAGGFDEDLLRGEDVELGFRLESRGANFKFSSGAAAYHRGYRPYASWRNSNYLYGQSDVQLGILRGHPQVLNEITRWYKSRPLPIRAFIKTSMIGGAPVKKSFEFGLKTLGVMTEKIGMHRLSHISFSLIYGINYWQGAADELGGIRALDRCVYGTPEYRAELASATNTAASTQTASEGHC